MKAQSKVGTGIANFLLLPFLIATLTACQTGLKTRQDVKTKAGEKSETLKENRRVPQPAPVPPPPTEPDEVTLPPAESFLQKEPPKVGLILGGGGMRAWAHVGVLREMARAQVPIHGVVGLEWGSVVGALYSNQAQINEVEWKMMKLRDDDLPGKGFLSTRIRPESIERLNGFWQDVFAGHEMQKFRVDFACGTYSLRTEKLFWLNKGSAADAMKKCVPYPPYFTDTSNQVATPFAIEEAAGYLRARGANLIIFVNPLAQGEIFSERMKREQSAEWVLWAEVRRHAARSRMAGVNLVIPVATGDSGILDFDRRRDLIEMGSKAAREHVNKLSKQYGF